MPRPTVHTAVRVASALSAGLALALSTAGAAVADTAAATGSVNIRSGAGTAHAVVGGLVRGQRITTTSAPRNGWVAVRFAGTRAYVASRYVDSSGALPAMPRRIGTAGTKVVTATLKVRSGPAPDRSVVGTLREGSRVTLTGRLSGRYAQTRYEGRSRWVSMAYLASTPAARTRTSAPAPATTKGRVAVAFAKRQLGKPYAYGAAGPSRYDCSGLTLAAWRSAGVALPRTSQQQYRQGKKVAKSALRPGDLVFFYSQSPGHVGIYIGDGRIIHSPRPGRSVEYSKLSYMPYAGAVRPG